MRTLDTPTGTGGTPNVRLPFDALAGVVGGKERPNKGAPYQDGRIAAAERTGRSKENLDFGATDRTSRSSLRR